ncbi:MAG: hypothetical protein A2Y45_03895 [Tenericutes bacterium GWC2_34_14]|nr:MAG: hypothetical protein A2Y45_03895 [Tenericutes bacterium GWC2_34_14]OHE33783.1 MAG: hypothetical protein A2012_07290 [Tenericutes bacterium GWE2_34_108]OHE36342.1 MAG: hypothetical protein A2Y46_00090 [Tenericutes bacterium GWF1_35_14]OHE37726.1 MAG: hypothetical protein A2Y44_00045 [Tenericutes bacterium GWF2_35_184]OHE44692.1 MAG: hypothetical protein A2221_00615 [Tenericutes bacterium RIFOXYA2_FULL_36_32]OHE47844.1 MAG: hypothetical protein A2308_00150 [Tenericutes bacterium RIFOXYB2
MDKQIKLSEWIQRFKSGEFDKPDSTTQIKAGWFDWFCRDSSLVNKTIKMGNIIKQFKAGGKVDLETSYVWFKNNCPLNGPLYDDFRIADNETNNNLFVVQIDCVWNDFKYTVFERLDGFEKPVFQTNSSRELVKWFNKGWSK